MTKSELIDRLAKKHSHLAHNDASTVVNLILKTMASSLTSGRRVEIRGFGAFSLNYRPGKIGRNPKSGDPVEVPGKYVPHFKPGLEMRERVNVTG